MNWNTSQTILHSVIKHVIMNMLHRNFVKDQIKPGKFVPSSKYLISRNKNIYEFAFG